MKQTDRMELANSRNNQLFSKYLDDCERSRVLTVWEDKFVGDMRDLFDSRESAMDLGQTPWSPTVNQWNTLHGIWSKL